MVAKYLYMLNIIGMKLGLIKQHPKEAAHVDSKLSAVELELLLNTLSNSVIQLRGKDLQTLYELILKLQNQYNELKQ
tara:strand:+ start:10024 stop:10254 length:231 start_codon:yes stop_codon:yes gene_type:complete